MKIIKHLAVLLAVTVISTAMTASCSKKQDSSTEKSTEPIRSVSEPTSEIAVPEKKESIISVLTDPELCLLEQLMYIDENVAKAASSENSAVDFYRISKDDTGKTVSEILSVFDEKAIESLRIHKEPVCDAQISGLEWAGLLDLMKNSRIASLVLEDIMLDETGYKAVSAPDGRKYNYPLALCFSDDSDSEAIVSFRGTTGPAEWADDVRAATLFDTPLQRTALGFVQSSAENFSRITVVGHSKGSNKAMYSAIMCDNVVRCVGFDGQGFSKLFIESQETAERIEARASLIRNYSLTGDFVNILLYQIPGSHQLFCKGFCVDSVGENHSPNSFFQQSDYELKYETVKKGDTVYKVPIFEASSEDPSMAVLRSFTDYMLSNGDNADDIIEYLAKITPILMTGEDEAGSKYDSGGKVKAVLSDPVTLAALISDLRQFAKENELNGAYADSLLGALGVDDLGIVSLLTKHN